MWFFLCCSFVGTILFASEPDDVSEMVQFQLDRFSSHRQLQFSLSGERYKVQLVANDDLVNDKSTETCHYFGYILEPTKYQNSSNLALSLCPNRGIRGSITTHDKRIYIMPSSSSPQHDHKLTDHHLVSVSPQSNDRRSSSRHLLSSWDSNKVELYVMTDPKYTKMFKDKFGSSWKSNLIAQVKDEINQASAEYERWDWGNAGQISLSMITLEIVEDFTGIYTNLRPPWKYGGCTSSDHWSKENCNVDGVAYLKKFRTFVKENNRYGDDVIMLCGMDFAGAQGWGGVGTVCGQNAGANIDSPHFIRRIKTIAHEIGHNFGMQHDSPLVGIMGNDPNTADLPKKDNGALKMIYDPITGKGDVDLRKIGWSTKSYDYLNAYFKKKNGLQCLKDGVRSFKTIYNPSSGSGSSYGSGSSGGSSYGSGSGSSTTSSSCVEIRSLSSNLNGEWQAKGVTNGKKRYKNPNNRGKRWLYWTGRYWTMNHEYTATVNANSYCTQSRVKDCDRKWMSFGRKAQNSLFKDCGSFTTDEEGLECWESNEYEDSLCLYDDDSGYREFGIAEMCYNDRPVYEYLEDRDISYHLYADTYYEYLGNNSNVSVSQWVISLHDVASQDIVATCDEYDLLQCFDGNWQVLYQDNDTLAMVVAQTMNVQNGKCATSATLSSISPSTTVAFWICGGFAVVLILSIFVFIICRPKQSKKVAVDDESEEEEEEAEEIEVEVGTELTATR